MGGETLIVALALMCAIACCAAVVTPKISVVNNSLIISIPLNSSAKISWLDGAGQPVGTPCSIVTQCDFQAFQSDILSQIAALSTRVDGKADSSSLASLSSSVQALNTNLPNVERSLSSNLGLEEARALSTEYSLAASNAALSNSLSSSISSERSRALLSEQTLAAVDISLATSNNVVSTSSSIAVAAERARALSAEASIALASATLVSTEASRAVVSELSLAFSVAAAAAVGQAASSAAAAVGQAASSAVAVERSRALVAEASIVTSATAISLATASEMSRALSVESSLAASSVSMATTASMAVALERTRAMAIESSLALADAAEAGRAAGVEASLSSSIVAMGAVASAAVAAERMRALAAEASVALASASSLLYSIGCAAGYRSGFNDLATFPTIAACTGRYTGNIGGASALAMCASGWHVCRGNDAVLATISGTQATAFSGCFAYDSAHDCNYCASTCNAILASSSTPCYVQATNDADLAGLGGSCSIGSGSGASVNCIDGPRIDAYPGNWGCLEQPSSTQGRVGCRGP
jgi:hypothetical protein